MAGDRSTLNSRVRRDRSIIFNVGRVTALAWIALGGSVSIATADDRGICGASPPKSDTIAACTRVIASPRTSAHDRAVAYGFRGDVLRARGDSDGAIADYDQALTLLRDYLPALNGRGLAYQQMGNMAKAIADFDTALRLDPHDAKALYERGMAKRKSGDTAGGDADITAAKAINPDVAGQM
ncbi:MAG TPA: tetratricopeptide repeat protein [Xanthobacteraceae bacterium]|nr:tetratricopeptide repeat protein [Xanthobacteraceae bacterium]